MKRKAFKIKTATRLALIFAAIMSVAAVALYILFVHFFSNRLLALEPAAAGEFAGIDVRAWEIAASSARALIPVLVAVIFGSFLICSLIIDRALNPLREMTEKLRSVASRNYKTRIFIDSSEEELRDYAIAFNDMAAKVGDHIERQKRFISDASHELVTPVAVIAGHSDMLLRWGKEDAELLASSLATVRREAFAMNALIENLLFFARTDSGRQQYRMRRIDAAALAEECLAEQRLLHPDFRIALDADAGARIALRADADALRRVFRILFDNAVKYSPDAKEIRVSIDADRETARIRVSDKGVGMERAQLERIFDRFYRADDSRTRESGGSGLGLAIAKEIVGAHGGEIEADGAPGAGTTVTMRLPILPVPS
jgi:signal transduction histidine kinase